jgi:tRNA (guanine37-N1)-methyltransferase
MRIAVVTVFPEALDAVTGIGVSGRAVRDGGLVAERHQPEGLHAGSPSQCGRPPLRRRPRHGDAPGAAGGGDWKPARAFAGCRGRCTVIYLSPQGRRFDDARARELALHCPAWCCWRVATRASTSDCMAAQVDEELSIGDYVLSGGELAAMVVIDAVTRLLPGTLGHAASAQEDSFATTACWTARTTRARSAVCGRQAVPEVLLSGDHAAIGAGACSSPWAVPGSGGPELLARRGMSDEEAGAYWRLVPRAAAGVGKLRRKRT